MPEERSLEDKMIKCVVFLGNPGREYERTRHNAGFLLCDYLYPGVSYLSKFHSFYFTDGHLKLMKPLTYMNLSGTAVSECASFFKLGRREILVVHDDLELPAGRRNSRWEEARRGTTDSRAYATDSGRGFHSSQNRNRKTRPRRCEALRDKPVHKRRNDYHLPSF